MCYECDPRTVERVPICCGLDTHNISEDMAVFGCWHRCHHPEYITPALASLLREAHEAGRDGQSFAAFLESRDYNTELDDRGEVVRGSYGQPTNTEEGSKA